LTRAIVQSLFDESDPEVIDLELADSITDPTAVVPFIYSMKPKKISEFLPKIIGLPLVDGVFNFDIEKLINSQSGSEKKDLVY
jgi:hypothetical protein